MLLVSHHTNEGQHMALIVKTGRKYLHVLYMGAIRLKRIPLSETRYFRSETEATQKQVRQFNRCAKRFGATKVIAR